MKFIIHPEIFAKIPTLCAGIVVTKNVDNSKMYPEIQTLLDAAIEKAAQEFQDVKVKESPFITPYRDAFRELDINPNKFQCSIEALLTRISKGKGMPHINSFVDLNNAVSLTYKLPMGTHDLAVSEGDIEMRLAKTGDTFIPFGETEKEEVPENEVVYAVGQDVRTRRWTWRQSEVGKITEETQYVFFPIDGFTDVNADVVKQATEDLAKKVQEIFKTPVLIGFVDKDHPSMDLSL